MTCVQTLIHNQSPSYSTASLHSFIIVLFEKYAKLLEAQFSRRFDSVSFFRAHDHCYAKGYCFQIIQHDDHLSMYIETTSELATVLEIVWLSESEQADIEQ